MAAASVPGTLSEREVHRIFKARSVAGALEPAALTKVCEMVAANSRGDDHRARRLVDRIFTTIRALLEREAGTLRGAGASPAQHCERTR